MEYLTIQTAAKRVGCCPATLRQYERQGAVVPGRDSAGRRVYTAADVERAREIKRQREVVRQKAQREGFARWRESEEGELILAGPGKKKPGALQMRHRLGADDAKFNTRIGTS